jgi:type I restriction enzyme R subunit
MARELGEIVPPNTTMDWTINESARAKIRAKFKRILRKYDFPPDKQERATLTLLEQAEPLCRGWAA